MTSPIHTRVEPIQAAPQPPVRPTPTPLSALAAGNAPTVPIGSIPSAIANLNPQPNSNSLPAVSSIPDSVLSQAVAAALAAVSAQSTSSFSPPGVYPTNTGTFFAPFRVFIEHDNASSITSHYQSITFMQHYQIFSFEELRLADCRAGRGPVKTTSQTGVFGQGNHCSSAAVPPTASAPVNVQITNEDQPTQIKTPSPGPSVGLPAPSSHPSTPGTGASNTGSQTSESSATIVVRTGEDLTALTANDIAKFYLVHETRAKVTKLVKNDENRGTWNSQGVGPIRILASKDTYAPRILMQSDPSGKVGLDLDVLLDCVLYKIKVPKILQLNVLADDKKQVESFMCMFKDEFRAEDFLDKLRNAIAKAQGSSASHPSLSLSEIKVQETEPVEKPDVVNCPFCRLGFYPVSEALQHLETTSCCARPDLNRGNIYHHLQRYDTDGDLTESFSENNVSISSNEEFLYHCPSMTGKCQGKLLPSFAALLAHLESEDCGFEARSDLLQDISNIERFVPTFGSC